MELLCDLQRELENALNSLAGKESDGLLDNFLVYSARYINNSADGYIFLRKASRIDASKLLIRPSIDAVVRSIAVQKQPDLLYRIAYTDRMEHKRMARPIAVQAGVDYDTETEKGWSAFKRKYSTHFPKHKLVEKELKLSNAAEIAGIKGYYDRPYRLYCGVVHASFKAMRGDTHTDPFDNWTMASCVCGGLDLVVAAGGEAPKLVALCAQLSALDPGAAKPAN